MRHQEEYCEEVFRLSSALPVKEALGLPDGTIEDTKRFIQRVMEEEREGKTVPRVILNEESKLIGLTDLMFIDHQKNLVTLVLGLHYVFAGARVVNILSQKTQEKLPFIRLHVEAEFPEEHKALEKKEKQPCVLNVFCKEDFSNYLNRNDRLTILN
ncbi:N-acetyltransferase [Planococcus halocryophilus]|uniref:N-acetyltransferase n=1 Tax=Planococcus halocryophilus TaxID=1215089 RepID=UPI002E814EC1|nr:N-acetyltransferase [Planococcus halocryophilus]